MTNTYRVLYQGQPGTFAAPVYTVPSNTQAIVKHIRAVNVVAVLASLKIFQGGIGSSNIIIPAVPLDAGEWMEFDGTIVGGPGDLFGAQASVANAITLTIYGLEVS